MVCVVIGLATPGNAAAATTSTISTFGAGTGFAPVDVVAGVAVPAIFAGAFHSASVSFRDNVIGTATSITVKFTGELQASTTAADDELDDDADDKYDEDYDDDGDFMK